MEPKHKPRLGEKRTIVRLSRSELTHLQSLIGKYLKDIYPTAEDFVIDIDDEYLSIRHYFLTPNGSERVE